MTARFQHKAVIRQRAGGAPGAGPEPHPGAAGGGYRMLYRDWLTLSTHLIWCYDHAVLASPDSPEVQTGTDQGPVRAWLVRAGWIEIRQNGQRLRAGPGQWLLLDNTRHTRSILRGTRILSVAFEATWPDGASLFGKGLPLVVDAGDYPQLERRLGKVARLMRIPDGAYDIREQPTDYRTVLRLERDFSDWMLALLDVLVDHHVIPSGHFSIDDRVMKAVRLLDAHPLGQPLDLNALAASVGISQVHLTRIFTSALHSSPRHYHDRRRLEQARCRLGVSGARIKEIAYSLGFHDLSHFSKWFKKANGITPRAYVRKLGTGGNGRSE